MKTKIVFILFLLCGFVFAFAGCKSVKKERRIFYVNSYHEGYGSSDDVMAAIREKLAGKNVKLETFFLDAKRKSSEEEIAHSSTEAKAMIDKFQPDLLIVSDDNAVQSLVVPYFNNTEMPVVFCGVNWSAEQYHLGKNVTGMLEVLPLFSCIAKLKLNYPKARKLVVLSENSVSEQNNKMLLDTLYRNMGMEPEYFLTEDFEEWKALFLKANHMVDLVYMPTNGAIKNWKKDEAVEFVKNNIKVPVFTCDDFMMPYCVFGLTKVAQEQGEWAASTANEILNGKKPEEIPYARNQRVKAYINETLTRKIEFTTK